MNKTVKILLFVALIAVLAWALIFRKPTDNTSTEKDNKGSGNGTGSVGATDIVRQGGCYLVGADLEPFAMPDWGDMQWAAINKLNYQRGGTDNEELEAQFQKRVSKIIGFFKSVNVKPTKARVGQYQTLVDEYVRNGISPKHHNTVTGSRRCGTSDEAMTLVSEQLNKYSGTGPVGHPLV